MLSQLAAIAAGGALGGVARHLLGLAVTQRLGEGWPWATLFVNVTGAFGIGLLAALLPAGGVAQAGLVTGFLGSFTTVSAFSLQTLSLWQAGRIGPAALNVAASLTLCLAAVAAGFLLAGGE